MSDSATADRQAPRLGLAGSLVLHAGIIAVTFFTWAHRLDITDQSPPIVPVDLVTVADRTNIAPVVAEAPELPPQVEELPPPEPKPQPAPQPKKDIFDINNILALLNRRSVAANEQKITKPGTQNIKGVGAQNAMTMDLADALRNQISQCWSPPVGAPHPDQLIVSFELFLNRDGSVAQPPQLTANSAAAVASDPFMRAAAEAARRAIYTCEPYRLPADRYGQWRDITLVFDPRLMIGQ